MDEDKVRYVADAQISKFLENLGVDTSTIEARKEVYLDFLFLRELRERKTDITQSIWKGVLEKISQGVVTALAVLFGSAASWFLSHNK